MREPVFSVTRLTACALPLNEWVSSRWRYFTLFQRPACVAFTIRVCSRRTLRSTSCQSMACQLLSLAEEAALAGFLAECGKGAPRCCAGVICSPLSAFLDGFSNSLVMKDPAEVCSLSGAVMFQSLSASLQSSLRFLRVPLPASPSAPLANGLPLRSPAQRRDSGLPCSMLLPV